VGKWNRAGCAGFPSKAGKTAVRAQARLKSWFLACATCAGDHVARRFYHGIARALTRDHRARRRSPFACRQCAKTVCDDLAAALLVSSEKLSIVLAPIAAVPWSRTRVDVPAASCVTGRAQSAVSISYHHREILRKRCSYRVSRRHWKVRCLT